MKRRTQITIVLALAALACLGAESEEPEPLVRVDGHEITSADLEESMRAGDAPRPEALPTGEDAEYEQLQAQIKKTTLQRLIDRHLLLQKAREKYLGDEGSAEQMEVLAERQFERLSERVGSRMRLQHMLSEQGLTVAEFKLRRAEDLLVNRLLIDEVYDRVHVTPGEIRAYYGEHRDEFRLPRKIVYRQIFLPVVSREREASGRELAEDLRRKILAGEDFAELADEYSADAERYPGGLHEVSVPEEQGDWLPPAVQGLEPGQVSEVREVSGGFAIVRLEEISPAHVQPFRQVQSAIRERLLEEAKMAAYDNYVKRLREQAVIIEYPAASELGL